MGGGAPEWHDAAAYERFMGRWSRPMADRFVAWAGVRAGARVIDVGCGTGALTAALLRAGAAAVVGTDRSADYVAACAHAYSADARVQFRQADAMDLREPTGAFDAAMSSLVANFVPDPGRMVAEMARVTRSGGTVALCVWDYAGRMEMLRRFWDVACEVDPEGAPAHDEGRTFPLCNPPALANLLQSAPLREVRTEALEVPMRFPSFDDLWGPFLGGSGPAQRYVVGLAPELRELVRERLRGRVAPAGDGTICLRGGAWAAAGVRR